VNLHPAALINAYYLSRLVRSPRGRATLLAFMADAEESDEGRVFETLLERVDDPALHKLVKIHHTDEQRHARILHAAVTTVGAAPAALTEDLRITLRINRMLGDFGAELVAGRRTVMEAYVLLQVIEERAVKEFPAIIRALEAVDPESAAVVRTVVRDEERHVKYARAISKRYAPDPETLAATLRRIREVEARAFAEHQRAFLRFVVANDLLDVTAPERLFWRAVAA
jgi:rubrerythrin